MHCAISSAQSNVTFYGGTNYSNVTRISENEDNDIDTDESGYIGYQIGIQSDLSLSSHLALSTGIEYQRIGDKFESNGAGSRFEYIFREDYIKIPLMLKIRTSGVPNEGGLFLSAGPYFGYWIAVSDKTEFEADPSNTFGINGTSERKGFDEVFGDNQNENVVDVGARLTAGVDLPLGSLSALRIAAAYDFGFVDIIETESNENNFNRVLALNLGLVFPL